MAQVIIDTSALLAVLLGDPDAGSFENSIARVTAPHALAEATGEPLLFKGEDFARTDVEAA